MKHRCQYCEKVFARHWNRDRHMRDVHPMHSLSHPFLRQDMNQVNTGLRFRLFKHDTPYFRSASPPSQHKDILDSSLEILSKLADCKRLKEEHSVTPIRDTYLQFNQFPPQSVNAHPILRVPDSGFGDNRIPGDSLPKLHNCTSTSDLSGQR